MGSTADFMDGTSEAGGAGQQELSPAERKQREKTERRWELWTIGVSVVAQLVVAFVIVTYAVFYQLEICDRGTVTSHY